MPTLKDVAKAAGVSTATASRALNGSLSISAQTKLLVREAAIKVNYKSNRNAQLLEYKKLTIAIMAPQIISPFYATLVSGIQDAAMARNYAVLLFCAEDDPVSEKKAMDILLSMDVLGIVAIPPATEQTNYTCLFESDRPIVFVGYQPSASGGSYVVAQDGHVGAAIATEHLVKQGLKSIVLIAGPENTSIARERSSGYLEVMKRHSLVPSVYTGPSTYYAGYQIGVHLFEAQCGQNIEAVIAGSDSQSLGILHAAQKSGRRIPADISLISFDDTYLATMSSPTLTSVSYPLYRMGVRAFEILFNIMQGAQPKDQCKMELFKPVLLSRNSSLNGGQA